MGARLQRLRLRGVSQRRNRAAAQLAGPGCQRGARPAGVRRAPRSRLQDYLVATTPGRRPRVHPGARHDGARADPRRPVGDRRHDPPEHARRRRRAAAAAANGGWSTPLLSLDFGPDEVLAHAATPVQRIDPAGRRDQSIPRHPLRPPCSSSQETSSRRWSAPSRRVIDDIVVAIETDSGHVGGEAAANGGHHGRHDENDRGAIAAHRAGSHSRGRRRHPHPGRLLSCRRSCPATSSAKAAVEIVLPMTFTGNSWLDPLYKVLGAGVPR